MLCPKCEHPVTKEANFCSHCGARIEREVAVGDTFYGIFYLLGESYTTSLELTRTEAEVFLLLNSGQSSTTRSNAKLYLGELQLLDRETHDDPSITRYKVLDWWIVTWNGMRWVKGMRLHSQPNMILLSSLEHE